MSDRVLVPMSRSEAGWYDALGEGTGHGPTHRPIRAALDTDREELEARIAAELYRQGVKFEGSMSERVEHAAGTARAVLALLEGADDEC